MEAKVNFVVVGVFVIVLTTALIAGVLWLSSGKYYRKNSEVYETYMSESVSGLNLDAPVRYRGVDVGHVRRIALAPGNVEQVQVTLDIDPGTPIKEDTVAVLQTQGLTGISYVELTGGHRDAPPLKARAGETVPVIKSGASLMNRLESSSTVLLDNLNRASDNINALLDEDNRRAIRSTIADLQVLSRTLAARSATIDAGLGSAARTADNAARFTATLPDLTRRVERSAEAFDRMTNQLGGAGASASTVLDTSRGDLRQFTSETLPEVRELVAELRDLTATLRRVSHEIETNPGVLLAGKPAAKPGPGE